VKSTPDPFGFWIRFLFARPRLNRVVGRIVNGSTGAEIWSCITILLLVGAIQSPPTSPRFRGTLIEVLLYSFPRIALVMIVVAGVSHVVALGMTLSRWSIAMRKFATAIEVTAWSTLIVDLVHFHQIGTAISLGVLVVLLYVSLLRRRYIV
jgi:hypothetical protein